MSKEKKCVKNCMQFSLCVCVCVCLIMMIESMNEIWVNGIFVFQSNITHTHTHTRVSINEWNRVKNICRISLLNHEKLVNFFSLSWKLDHDDDDDDIWPKMNDPNFNDDKMSWKFIHYIKQMIDNSRLSISMDFNCWTKCSKSKVFFIYMQNKKK